MFLVKVFKGSDLGPDLGSCGGHDGRVALGLQNGKVLFSLLHHYITCVKGLSVENAHTQGIENFWSCLKRTLNGTYVAVEPFHLDAYVDEQVLRCNNRHDSKRDAGRFKSVLKLSSRILRWAWTSGWLRCGCLQIARMAFRPTRSTAPSASAWFMLRRIRTAMKQNGGLLGEGPVEVDEVYISGKPSNMHVDKRFRDGKEILKGDRKTPVLGMLDRGSREFRAKDVVGRRLTYAELTGKGAASVAF